MLTHEDPEPDLSKSRSLIAELEAVLLEYVERYGVTDRARHVLSLVAQQPTSQTGDGEH